MRPCVVLLFAVSLLTLCEAQGINVTPVFVLKGRDLLLKFDADLPEGVLFVEWKINKTVTLVRFLLSGKQNVHEDFTGRLEFPEKNSVTLKNLQEADSGVYAAEVVTETPTGDKQLAEYKVTVQGPVSPVELIVDRVDNSSESCDLHVTCRTHNSNISSTFRCVDRVCSQGGGERSEVTTSGASLQVYLLNNVIICNHSNQVNWTQDFKTTEHFCPSHPADSPSPPVWVIASCTAALTLILIVVLSVWLCIDQKRRISSRRSVDNVIYEAAQDETSAPQNPTNDVTYSSVKFHARSPQAAAATGRNQSESLYAEVKKPGRSFND